MGDNHEITFELQSYFFRFLFLCSGDANQDYSLFFNFFFFTFIHILESTDELVRFATPTHCLTKGAEILDDLFLFFFD